MKLFRQVSTTERLPQKDGWYFTSTNMARLFKEGQWWNDEETRHPRVSWFLEELPELPTEEEIKEAIENLPYNDDMSPNDVGLQGASYILNLIKNK